MNVTVHQGVGKMFTPCSTLHDRKKKATTVQTILDKFLYFKNVILSVSNVLN